MPNWDSILREIATEQSNIVAAEQSRIIESAFDRVRRKYLRLLNEHTRRNVIAYYSGFLTRPNIDVCSISDEDKNGFMLCIHELTREGVGLDLILHTPGGDTQATVSLVDYLRAMFGRDIRAIVPQIAMSAGTMLACSCKNIVMGKQSSLGPIDPQFGFVGAANLLAEVKKARDDIIADPRTAQFWTHILSRITPSFLERCEWAVKDSEEFLSKTLRDNMFADLAAHEIEKRVSRVQDVFGNNKGRAHNTHIQYQECRDCGLEVDRLEDDQTLQDIVLTLHHCYMHTISHAGALKVIENHLGRAIIRHDGRLTAPMQPQASIQEH